MDPYTYTVKKQSQCRWVPLHCKCPLQCRGSIFIIRWNIDGSVLLSSYLQRLLLSQSRSVLAIFLIDKILAIFGDVWFAHGISAHYTYDITVLGYS